MTDASDTILQSISELMRDLFDEYDGPITRETTANDVGQWDSLSNVQLIVFIEQQLGVTFSSTEVQSFKNLGDLVDAVAKQRQK